MTDNNDTPLAPNPEDNDRDYMAWEDDISPPPEREAEAINPLIEQVTEKPFPRESSGLRTLKGSSRTYSLKQGLSSGPIKTSMQHLLKTSTSWWPRRNWVYQLRKPGKDSRMYSCLGRILS